MDPYKVLGVSETASDDEIKSAYRKLVKKYHPDQYRDNPLSDLAQEKLKEINDAYAEIEKMRSSSGSSGYSGSYGGSQSYGGGQSYSGQNGPIYTRVRASINAGNLREAEMLLAQVSARDAEWFYLMGCIYRRKGWHNEATQHFAQAAKMNPNNQEYANALNDSARRAGYYTGTSAQRGSAGGCDICTTLCAADCCCECLGGDLIPCC